MTTSSPKRASYSGRVIVPLVATNPRKPGTVGFNSWNRITFGMTYDAYILAGGRRQDIDWDRARGWVKFADETPLLLMAGPAIVTEPEPSQDVLPMTKAQRKAQRSAAA